MLHGSPMWGAHAEELQGCTQRWRRFRGIGTISFILPISSEVLQFVLGFTSRGCRESGLMDCCTVGAANRALLSVKERKVFSPGAIEWWNLFQFHCFNTHFQDRGSTRTLLQDKRASKSIERLYSKSLHFLAFQHSAGGHGFLTISTNIVECANSWDGGRWESRMNLNEHIGKLRQSASSSVMLVEYVIILNFSTHCGMSPSSVRRRQPHHRRLAFDLPIDLDEIHSKCAGRSSLQGRNRSRRSGDTAEVARSSLHGLVWIIYRGWKVGKTSKVAGRTQGEFAALITSTRDLNVEKRPDNSFLIIHRETDDRLRASFREIQVDHYSVIVRRIDSVLTCKHSRCHRVTSNPICAHLYVRAMYKTTRKFQPSSVSECRIRSGWGSEAFELSSQHGCLSSQAG